MTEQPSTPSPAGTGGGSLAPVMDRMSRLDRSVQLVMGAGVVVAILGVLGSAIETWSFEYAGLLLLVAGLGGAALAWLIAEGRLSSLPISGADLLLAAGGTAAALGILALVTILGDLDQLDDEYGGVLGVVVSALAAAAGLVLLAGAWRTGEVRPTMQAIRSSGRGLALGLAGAALALLGWVGNLTVGVWNFAPSAVVITLIVVGAVLLLAATRDRTPAPGGTDGMLLPLGAIVVAALAALVMFDHFGLFSRLADRAELGIEDWLAFGAYALGVVGLLAGAVLALLDRRAATPASAPAG